MSNGMMRKSSISVYWTDDVWHNTDYDFNSREDGFSKIGEQVVVPLMNGKIIEATVTDTIFYDKEGKRNNE